MPFISSIFRYTLPVSLRFFFHFLIFKNKWYDSKRQKIGSRVQLPSFKSIDIWHQQIWRENFNMKMNFLQKKIKLMNSNFWNARYTSMQWTLWRPKKNLMLKAVQVTNNSTFLLSFSFLFCCRCFQCHQIEI